MKEKIDTKQNLKEAVSAPQRKEDTSKGKEDFLFEEQKKENPHQEKREHLYKNIDVKISWILGLEEAVEAGKHLKPREFDSFMRGLVFSFGSGRRPLEKGRKKLFGLENKYYKKLIVRGKLLKKRQVASAPKKAEKIDGKIQAVEAKMKKIETEISRLQKNDTNADFYNRMTRFYINATAKKRRAYKLEREYAGNRPNFWEKMREEVSISPGAVAFFEKVSKDEIEVAFSGLDINFIVPSEIYDEFFSKTASGIHIFSTVVSFIRKREDPKEVAQTIKHEQTHGITECFLTKLGLYERENLAASLVDILNGEPDLVEGKSMADEEKNNAIGRLQKALAPFPKYIDSHYDEIISDFETVKKGEITTYFSNFAKTLDNIKKIGGEVEGKEARDLILKIAVNMEEPFVRYLNKLSNLFFIAKNCDDEERLKGALLLFKPQKVDRILKYFERKHGKERCDFYRAIQPLVLDGGLFKDLEAVGRSDNEEVLEKGEETFYYFSSLNWLARKYFLSNEKDLFYKKENVEQLDRTLSSEKVVIDEELKFEIKLALLKSSDKVYLEEDLCDIENLLNFKEYLDCQKRICDKLGFESDYFQIVERCLVEHALSRNIFRMIERDDFNGLEKFYFQFPASKKMICKVRDNWIIKGYKKQGKEYDRETIKTSEFWKFLEKAGLDKE